MNINKIDNQAASFKSKLVPNNLLEGAFKNAEATGDRYFVQSVKAILNDGKNDSLEIAKTTKDNLSLFVNGEKQGETLFSYYGNPVISLIEKYAKDSFGTNIYADKYQNLTGKEKELIKEDIDLMKMLLDNFDAGANFIAEVQKTITQIKQKLDINTKKEIQELKKIIFSE